MGKSCKGNIRQMQKGRIIWSVSLLTLFVCLLPLSVKIFGAGCFAKKVNLFDENKIDRAYQIIANSASENDEAESSAVNRESGAVVIEATTKRVLYLSNKDVKLFPASTTKILTALTVFKQRFGYRRGNRNSVCGCRSRGFVDLS